LFERSGKRATIISSVKGDDGEEKRMHEFLYIRKDLIEHYLDKTSQRLLVWMGGEREFATSLWVEKEGSEDFPSTPRVMYHDVVVV